MEIGPNLADVIKTVAGALAFVLIAWVALRNW